MSSCSVYGVADGVVDETSPVSTRRRPTPLQGAGRARRLGAGRRRLLADVPAQRDRVRRRPADALRHRAEQPVGPRLDDQRIAMTSDGTPWRPLVHALDIAKAIRMTLESPRERVHGEIFNVGSDDNNYQVRDIAEIVAAEFPGCELTLRRPERGQPQLPGRLRPDPRGAPRLHCDWDAETGAAQLHRVFAAIDLDEDDLHRPRPHPAQADRVPDAHQAGRRRAVLDGAVKFTPLAVDGVSLVELEPQRRPRLLRPLLLHARSSRTHGMRPRSPSATSRSTTRPARCAACTYRCPATGGQVRPLHPRRDRRRRRRPPPGLADLPAARLGRADAPTNRRALYVPPTSRTATRRSPTTPR